MGLEGKIGKGNKVFIFQMAACADTLENNRK
jgi:hypothetical protein